MVWLAFDYGERFIGVAVAEPALGAPNALTTLRAKAGTPDWSAVDRLVARWQPEGAVVGLPLNMDDTESEMSLRARRFARRLTERYGFSVEFADERLSSFEANDRAREARPRDPERRHALAAEVIAETWLAARARRAD